MTTLLILCSDPPSTSVPARVPPLEGYNELNTPQSPDFAIVLSWCMDKFFLHALPPHFLIPDGNFVPKETITTFFIDQDWFRCFLDGAFSMGEHFTDNDEVRESIKANLDDYLSTPLSNSLGTPAVPKWGFFLRSELVTKFPDMRIVAPRSTASLSKVPEVLRKITLDTDLLIALFDRTPTAADFPSGITLVGPEHQGTNTLGEPGDLDTSHLTMRWTPTTKEGIKYSPTTESNTFYPLDPQDLFDPNHKASHVFDFFLRLLNPDALTAAAGVVLKSESGEPIHTLDRTGWTAAASSEQNNEHAADKNGASNVLDGDRETIWHTKYVGGTPNLPQWIEIDMGLEKVVHGLVYLPRPESRMSPFLLLPSPRGNTYSVLNIYNICTNTASSDKTNTPYRLIQRHHRHLCHLHLSHRPRHLSSPSSRDLAAFPLGENRNLSRDTSALRPPHLTR